MQKSGPLIHNLDQTLMRPNKLDTNDVVLEFYIIKFVSLYKILHDSWQQMLSFQEKKKSISHMLSSTNLCDKLKLQSVYLKSVSIQQAV